MADTKIHKDKLLTRNFISMCAANFLMSFSFYILIPTLPFYLIDTFKAGQSVVGIILSIYTVSVLVVRPFSGFLADTFQRKPLYLFAYFIFASFFVGYPLAGSLLVFTIIRVIHGLAFGMLTTTGNTLVIDVMPSSRRGEGLGYFGVTGNIAMAIGPMTGLILKDIIPFDYIFYIAAISGAIGILFICLIKTPRRALQRSSGLCTVFVFSHTIRYDQLLHCIIRFIIGTNIQLRLLFLNNGSGHDIIENNIRQACRPRFYYTKHTQRYNHSRSGYGGRSRFGICFYAKLCYRLYIILYSGFLAWLWLWNVIPCHEHFVYQLSSTQPPCHSQLDVSYRLGCRYRNRRIFRRIHIRALQLCIGLWHRFGMCHCSTYSVYSLGNTSFFQKQIGIVEYYLYICKNYAKNKKTINA